MSTSSPITAADFPTFNPAADLCTKMDQLLGVSEKMKIWFGWAFDENGNWTEDAKAGMVESSTPVGSTILWPSGSIPSDKWLIANGAEVSRTTYSTLYSRIGTSYGSGNGTSTFNLPNLVGRFPVGAGTDPLAATGGERSVTLDTTELPDHTHTVQMARKDGADTGAGAQKVYGPDQAGFTDADITTDTTGNAAAAHENMPPFLALHYIIRVL